MNGLRIGAEIGDRGAVWLSGMYDRIKTKTPGLFGGEDGAAGSITAAPGVPLDTKAPHGLGPGIIIRLVQPGGKGCGKAGRK